MKTNKLTALRERIITYVSHGGNWKFLEAELVKYGFSENFSREYVCDIRQKLGKEEAKRAIEIFDIMDWYSSESEGRTAIKLCGLFPSN